MHALVDAIHAGGAKVSVRLFHCGRFAEPSVGSIPVSARSIASFGVHGKPAMLSEADIWQQVELFADTTRRAKQAGFDCFEVHSGHGYLVHSFLSPRMNRSRDQ